MSSGIIEKLREFYDERYTGEYLTIADDLEARRIATVLGRVQQLVNRLLDYGCGNGRWISLLTGVFPEAQLCGNDPSEVAIAQASERHPDDDFRVMKNDAAPFEDESFDLIFSYHVLEHVIDLEATVKDMARLVKPGGSIVAIFPCGNPGSFEEKTARKMIDGIENCDDRQRCFYFEDPSHRRRMTNEEIEAVFADVDCHCTHRFFANRFFGAIEWISKDHRDFVKTIFDPGKANGRVACLQIAAWQKVFAAIHHAKKAQNKAKKSSTFIAGIYKRFSLEKAIDAAAWLEWRLLNQDNRGSAQYLVFRKEEKN